MRVDGPRPPEGDDSAAAPPPADPASEEAAALRGSSGGRMAIAAGIGGAPAEPATPGVPGRRFQDFSGGKLFVHGVNADRIGQGNLGDCFFLSSLCSVAHTHPSIIEKMVKDNGNGTYTVTFHDGPKTVPVTVDAKFPSADHCHLTFAHDLKVNNPCDELWPAVFEKAYAKWQGSYAKLGKGGYGQVALEQITGAKSHYAQLSSLSNDELWKRIDAAAKANHPMVTGTFDDKTIQKKTGAKDGAGIVGAHDYTILGCREEGGEKMVKLRNPWGDTTPTLACIRPGEHGIFEMPLADFRKYWQDLAINDA